MNISVYLLSSKRNSLGFKASIWSRVLSVQYDWRIYVRLFTCMWCGRWCGCYCWCWWCCINVVDAMTCALQTDRSTRRSGGVPRVIRAALTVRERRHKTRRPLTPRCRDGTFHAPWFHVAAINRTADERRDSSSTSRSHVNGSAGSRLD